MDILRLINRVDGEKYLRRFLHGFNENKIFSVVFHGHVATRCSHLQPSSRTKGCFRVFQHLSASFFWCDAGIQIRELRFRSPRGKIQMLYKRDFLPTDLAVLTQMDV